MIQFIHQQLLPLLGRLAFCDVLDDSHDVLQSVSGIADRRRVHGKPDHAVVTTDETFLDRVKFELAGDLLAKCLPIRIGIVRMGVTKQSAGQKLLAAEAGDGANRFIDA